MKRHLALIAATRGGPCRSCPRETDVLQNRTLQKLPTEQLGNERRLSSEESNKFRDGQAGLGDNTPQRAPGEIAGVQGNSYFSSWINAMDEAAMASGCS